MKFERYKKTAKSEPSSEHFGFSAAKILMILIYLWSGFFWGGVTVYNFYALTPGHTHLATLILIGSVSLLVSLILCLKRAYLFQLPFAAAGTICYCIAAQEMMAHAEANAKLFKVPFGYRYLPVLGFCAIALVLFAVKLFIIIDRKNKQKEEYNNQPTKSILED